MFFIRFDTPSIHSLQPINTTIKQTNISATMFYIGRQEITPRISCKMRLRFLWHLRMFLIWFYVPSIHPSQQTNTAIKQTNIRPTKFYIAKQEMAQRILQRDTLISNLCLLSVFWFDLKPHPLCLLLQLHNKQTNTTTKYANIRPTKFYIGGAGNGSAHPVKISLPCEDAFDLPLFRRLLASKGKNNLSCQWSISAWLVN